MSPIESRFLALVVNIAGRDAPRLTVAETYEYVKEHAPQVLIAFFRKFPDYTEEHLLACTDNLEGVLRQTHSGPFARSRDEHKDEDAEPEAPPMYKVVLLNDDDTPQEFVVRLLEVLFGMDRRKAVDVMLDVHSHGSGVCGVFPHEIAETKVNNVRDQAKHGGYPLRCRMEEAESV